MKRKCEILGCLLLIALSASFFNSLEGAEQALYEQRLQRLRNRFEKLMETPRTRIPSYVLSRAAGIVIFQKMQVSFLVGVKAGNGVVLAREEGTGKWSLPAFIRTGEGSFGFQAGAHQITTVLVIMDPEVVRKLSETKFRIGIDAAAAAGPVGGDAVAKAGLPPIAVYMNSEGLYAGVSLEGGSISPARKANKTYYGGGKDITVEDILFKGAGTRAPAALDLVAAIEKYELR